MHWRAARLRGRRGRGRREVSGQPPFSHEWLRLQRGTCVCRWLLGNHLCRGLHCSSQLLTAFAKSEHSVPCHRKGKSLRFIGAFPGPSRRRRVLGVPVPPAGRKQTRDPSPRAVGRRGLQTRLPARGCSWPHRTASSAPTRARHSGRGWSASWACDKGLSVLCVCFHFMPYSST